MTRSSRILLEDILESIQLIHQKMKGVGEDEFVQHVEKQDAIVQRLEVIGEAVKGLPDELKVRYSEVPRRQIAGARDILIHEYFRVDLEMAWGMVKDDLPELETQVQKILKEEQE